MIHGMERGMRTAKTPAPAMVRLVFGLIIMLSGLLLTLDNFGLLHSRRFVRFWPVLLIGLGVFKLSHGLRSKARTAGFFLILMGVVLLLVNLGVLDLRLAFALFLLAMGAAIVWRAARSPRAAPGAAPDTMSDPSKHVDVSAFMAGVQRGLSSQDFRGGSLTALMGACEIDLTKASIEAGEAVINTFAFWGGIEIKVPPDWMVETRGTAVLGAFEDTSRRPDDDRKKLIVTGIAIMGGIEVKN
jgi:predicted membrane protein